MREQVHLEGPPLEGPGETEPEKGAGLFSSLQASRLPLAAIGWSCVRIDERSYD